MKNVRGGAGPCQAWADCYSNIGIPVYLGNANTGLTQSDCEDTFQEVLGEYCAAVYPDASNVFADPNSCHANNYTIPVTYN